MSGESLMCTWLYDDGQGDWESPDDVSLKDCETEMNYSCRRNDCHHYSPTCHTDSDNNNNNTLANSYLMLSASPGGAAEHAAARKSAKYSSLPPSHTFQPLAMETLRQINSTGISFFTELGRRLSDVSGDCRKTTYLFQRVFLAVQRYNSEAFKGTFTVPTDLDW